MEEGCAMALFYFGTQNLCSVSGWEFVAKPVKLGEDLPVSHACIFLSVPSSVFVRKGLWQPGKNTSGTVGVQEAALDPDHQSC